MVRGGKYTTRGVNTETVSWKLLVIIQLIFEILPKSPVFLGPRFLCPINLPKNAVS